MKPVRAKSGVVAVADSVATVAAAAAAAAVVVDTAVADRHVTSHEMPPALPVSSDDAGRAVWSQ